MVLLLSKATSATMVVGSMGLTRVNIVAIHNHMTFEQPRAMFLHFWGIGSTTDLAKGLKAALDAEAAVKPAPGGVMQGMTAGQ